MKEYSYTDSDIYKDIIHLPEQIYNAYHDLEPENSFGKKNFSQITICGMGGSAIAADIIKSILREQIDINVSKDFYPEKFKKDSLYILISYSGNTEEVLNFCDYIEKKCGNIAVASSGGKLLNIAMEKKYPFVKLPQGHQPRCAIGHLFIAICKILKLFFPLNKLETDIKKTISLLMQKAAAISDNTDLQFNLAKQTAKKFQGLIPLIYSSNQDLCPVAYRWKCQINENAKYPAFSNQIPEMNHNEIELFEYSKYQKKFLPVFLRYFEDDKKYINKLKALQKLFNNNGIDYLEFFAEGDSIMEKLFSLIYLGDMISFYLALNLKVPANQINMITELKEISKHQSKDF